MSKFYSSPVTGIDIAADFSIATILAPDGSIYKKPFRFNHDAEGFNYFLQEIKKVEEIFDKPNPVFMEATGIYHLNLFYFLINNKVESYVINPIVTNCNKNKEIRKVKNDKSDSYAIAKTGKFEDIKTCNMVSLSIYELRLLCREYYTLVDERADIKKSISNILRLIFPGYEKIFSDTTGLSSLAILKHFPSPEAVISARGQCLIDLLKTTSRKGLVWATTIYNKLIHAAQDALKISFLSGESCSKLRRLLALYDSYTLQISDVEKDIYNFIDSTRVDQKLRDFVSLLDGIPGIAKLSAITLLAEIGDIEAFKKPKQLVAFFGIDPSVNQSGKFNGTKNKMSKRGTKLGRKVLYAVVLTSIRNKRNGEANNPVLQQYYQENLKGKAKKVAFIAVMHKLLKYIFSVLKHQKPFEIRDPRLHEKMYLQNHFHAA